MRVNTFTGSVHLPQTALIGLAFLLPAGLLFGAACTKASYLEVQLTLPSAPVDFAQQVEWVDLSASDGNAFDAGPERIPASPVAGGLGAGHTKVILAVSAPNGAQVHVMVNGLDGAGNAIGSASGDSLLGPGTSTLNLTLTAHCAEPRDCDPAGICSGIVACDADWPVGYGACRAESAAIPDGGTPCGPSDAGHCDGRGACIDPYCGDGVLQVDAGEECDWGTGNSDTLPDHCRTDCQLPRCGDGVVDPDGGEACDLDAGNNGLGLGCNATCTLVGAVTTLAGNGAFGLQDGIGTAAEFGDPYGLAIVGRTLYVADTNRNAVRAVNLASAEVTTVAGGAFEDGGACNQLDGVGAAAQFCGLYALLAFDGGGLLAGDRASLRVVLPGADGGAVTTLAGWVGDAGDPPAGFQTGAFVSALYATPWGLTRIGDVIYSNSHAGGEIAASELDTRTVTLAGEASSGSVLAGMTSLGPVVYTADETSGRILRFDTSDAGAAVTTLASLGGGPDGLCTDGTSIYVCLSLAHTVNQLDPLTGRLTLVAGSGADSSSDGIGVDAGFIEPANCAWDPVGRALYVSDHGGQRIRKIQ